MKVKSLEGSIGEGCAENDTAGFLFCLMVMISLDKLLVVSPGLPNSSSSIKVKCFTWGKVRGQRTYICIEQHG
jgi:hypothetical protein